MIPLVDIKRQHAPIRKEIDQAIKKIIDNTAFVFGEENKKFGEQFAKYCGSKYGLGVGNGTDALKLAVYALGVGKWDEVICVANTFTASIDAIIHAGAKPVLVDCDEYFNIDPKEIEKKITKKTKGVIVVHLYGQAARMDEIMKIAKKHKLFVVEDAAQAHGAEFRGKRVGSFGIASCFSFYPGKNLGAMGDGGMIVTSNKRLFDKLEKLRYFGMGTDKYHHDFVGFNSRLDNLQAAVLRIKLQQLDKWNNERRRQAKLYNSLLKDVVEIPLEMEGARHVYHVYAIKTPKGRDVLLKKLHNEEIYAGLHYPIPLHLLKAHKNLGYKKGDFPNSERNALTALSLPIFPGMRGDEVEKVASSVRSFFK